MQYATFEYMITDDNSIKDNRQKTKDKKINI